MDELTELPADVPIAALQRLARGLLFDRERAEDVVQEAWLALLRKRPETTNLAAWMRTAVRHLALDARRQERSRATREQAAARPEAQPDPTDALVRIEVLRKVLDAFEALEEPYRAVIGLRFLEGLPPRAIARRLGLPVNTVRTRVHRGLELLRKRLDAGGRERERFLAVLAPFAGHMPWRLARPAATTALVASAAGVAFVAGAAWLVQAGRARSEPAAASAAELASAREDGGAAPAAREARREALGAGGRAELGGEWVVRGHVSRGRLGGLAGAPVHARLYGGYAPDGPLLAEEWLTSDASGDFAWVLEPPAEAARVDLETAPTGHLPARNAAILPRGGGAPRPFLLTCLALDAELTGTLRDSTGALVAGAEVSFGKDRSVVCDSDGRFRLEAASEQAEHRLWALAPANLCGAFDIAPFRSGESRSVDLELGPGRVVRGSVRDEVGAPIEGARVTSFLHAMLGFSQRAATSDAEGRFELLLGDDDGFLQLLARKAGFAPAKLSEAVLGEANRDVLRDPEHVDFVLRPGTQASGRVTDPDGTPIEGALVSLGVPFHDPPNVTATDAEGRFALAALPRAEVTLSAFLPGRERKSLELDLATAPDARELELVLGPATALTGLVLDLEDRPVPWALVYASAVRGCTDEEGRFVLEGVPASATRVVAESPGHASAELALDGTREDLVLRLAPSAALAGRVVDAASGAPLPRFTLRLVDLDHPGQRPKGIPTTWTDDLEHAAHDGAWHLQADFPAGLSVGVEARADGYAPAVLRAETALAPDPEACVLRLVRSTRVHGQVVDAASGAPLERVRVLRSTSTSGGHHLEDEGDQTWTDAEGYFELLDLPTGPMYLAVVPDPWKYASELDGPFLLEGTVERRVELAHGATLAGTLLDEGGSPVGGAKVSLRGLDAFGGRFGWNTSTGEGGRFEFRNLPGGDFTLSWTHTREVATVPQPSDASMAALGYSRPATFEREVEDLVESLHLETLEARDVVLQARGTTALSGTLGFAGALPEIVPVTLVRLDEADQPTARARGTFAERGAFSLPRMEEGRYELRAEFRLGSNRKATGRTLVDIPADGEAHAHLELAGP